MRSRVSVTCRQCGAVVECCPSSNRKFCSPRCAVAFNAAKRVDAENGTARCAKCKEWKPIAEFVKGVAGRPYSYCLPCNRAWWDARRRRLGHKRRTPAALARENARAYKREYNNRAHHNRRASGKFPDKKTLAKLLEDQDGRCAYCRVQLEYGRHVDHKQPTCRGGTNDITNLHYTCPRCNMRKGSMTHDEFLVAKSRPAVQW